MQKIASDRALSQTDLQVQFDSVHDTLANLCLGPAGLDIGAVDPEKVLITNTVPYLSGGVFASKTTAEVAFTATVHDIPADAVLVQSAAYLMTLDDAGAETLTMGAIADGATPLLPERPASGTPIGYVVIAVDAGATSFDATTDELSEGHLTVTYVDLGYLAPRFDIAQ